MEKPAIQSRSILSAHRPLSYECRIGIAEDIPRLEWNGEFSEHRAIIAQAFAAQAAGRGLVMVAAASTFPIAQLWVRFADQGRPPRFWAFRVMPSYQRRSIGAALLTFAEAELAKRNFDSCEIGVDRDNPRVQRLYQKWGYRVSYPEIEDYCYVTPSGEMRKGRADQWIMSKGLAEKLSRAAADASLPQTASEGAHKARREG
jgi:ribosomal protein S18 acetylase RimI-like enzyme